MFLHSCLAPAEFSKRYSKGVWKPSASLIRPSQLRSTAAPSPSLPLPTCWEPGSRQNPSTRQVLATLSGRSGRPQANKAPHSRPARVCAPRPPAGSRRSHAPRAPSQAAAVGPRRAAPAFARRPAAGLPPGHRAASTLRLPSSPPHPDPPAAPFLTGGRAGGPRGAEGARSGRRPPPRRARGFRRRVLELWVSRAPAARARSNESSSPPPSRARAPAAYRPPAAAMTPRERTRATVPVVAAAATEVAVASAYGTTR
ncbi:uncharacterized protein PS065_007992 [Dugong dugon]